MIAKENLYLNADKTKVVKEDSLEQAFLLAGKGTEIPQDVIEKYGLDKQDKEETPNLKKTVPSENKILTPATNKGKKDGTKTP